MQIVKLVTNEPTLTEKEKVLKRCRRCIKIFNNDDFYYFGDKGGMYSNCYTPDGYWVDKDGSWNRQSKRE